MPAPSLRSDELTVAQYRTISWPAVIAVILGLASAVALVSPIFSPVAVAAVVVAILALRQIAASEGQLLVYPGTGHLVTDSSHPDYDPEVADEIVTQTLSFLEAVDRLNRG